MKYWLLLLVSFTLMFAPSLQEDTGIVNVKTTPGRENKLAAMRDGLTSTVSPLTTAIKSFMAVVLVETRRYVVLMQYSCRWENEDNSEELDLVIRLVGECANTALYLIDLTLNLLGDASVTPDHNNTLIWEEEVDLIRTMIIICIEKGLWMTRMFVPEDLEDDQGDIAITVLFFLLGKMNIYMDWMLIDCGNEGGEPTVVGRVLMDCFNLITNFVRLIIIGGIQTTVPATGSTHTEAPTENPCPTVD